ncbi:putative ankyrin repeat protein RF_0381 [Anthonomus grandis grandis]|uniref:putative ankyrin repeat protein RF_0381 n=1 Tax=Anthonomus grandis grandis TaxID=2921223 RepID=UPI002165D6E8|nr:putative ankyrin repeat protein RF_0381 [Anthonomus grandis grandis]
MESQLQKDTTALFNACREGNNDIVRSLLENNTLIINTIINYDNVLNDFERSRNVRDRQHEKTAFLLAAESGQLDTIKLLEKYRAEITLRTSKGNTALHLAAKNNHLNVVKYLIEEKGFKIDEENIYGDTALNKAANDGALECIIYLINKDANVLKIDLDGKSVLYHAVFSGSLDCVKAIAQSIPEGVLKTHINYPTKKYELTALHWAVKEGFEDIVRYLLSKGADASLKTKFKKNARDLAKDPRVIRVLQDANK